MVKKTETDFRGKTQFNNTYSRRSEFVKQLPLSDMLPYIEEAFNSGVLAIKWHQYVPGWNDGDPCEFTIGDLHATTDPAVVAKWIYDEFADEDTYDEDFIVSRYGVHPDGITHDNFPSEILGANFEYAIRAEFGDDVEIVITPESTYLFDYECGY